MLWNLLGNFIISFFPSVQTGNPKGVMLTHGNVVADFSGFLKVTDVSHPLLSEPMLRKCFHTYPPVVYGLLLSDSLAWLQCFHFLVHTNS